MNEEHCSAKSRRSLEQRLAGEPELLEEFHQIADLRAELLAQGLNLDEVESRTVEKMRSLGQQMLRGLAQEKAQAAATEVLRTNPAAIKHRKKK